MSESAHSATPAAMGPERERPTRWLTFYTYSGPVTSLLDVLRGLLGRHYEYAAIQLVFIFVPLVVLAYGLRQRRYWAYRMNLLLLICDVAVAGMSGYYSPSNLLNPILGAAYATLFWALPNYIYFKKRQHLFT